MGVMSFLFTVGFRLIALNLVWSVQQFDSVAFFDCLNCPYFSAYNEAKLVSFVS